MADGKRDDKVEASVFAIVAAFTSGLDVCKRLRERRRRKKTSRRAHHATAAHVEPTGDELRLSNSLRQSPVDIQRTYERSYAAAGERFARGDAIAHASLTDTLLKLNTGLVAIISAFLSHGKNDHHPDYKSLTSLSDASRAEAIDALGQLYQRLSQSQIVLDRLRPRCQRCGSSQHEDCVSIAQPPSRNESRQRGGSARRHASRLKLKKSQTELVVVRRPRAGRKKSSTSSNNSSSTALSSAAKPRSSNTSSSSTASTTATTPALSPLPSPDLAKPPPRLQSNRVKSPPPDLKAAAATAAAAQPPAKEKVQSPVHRKPVKTAAATAAAAAGPHHQRPETWPHGSGTREPTLPFIQPQPFQTYHQHASSPPPPPYQPPRPPKVPMMTATTFELPGTTPPPPPPARHRSRQQQQQPQPKPLPQQPGLNVQGPRPLPINSGSPGGPSASSSNSLLIRNAAARGGGGIDTRAPSMYSFASDSTKLGEIPMRKWNTPFDFAAMERANAEAAATGNLPPGTTPPAVEGKGRRGGLGLFRFLMKKRVD